MAGRAANLQRHMDAVAPVHIAALVAVDAHERAGQQARQVRAHDLPQVRPSQHLTARSSPVCLTHDRA